MIHRYWKAFIGALRLTFTGDKAVVSPYLALQRWMDETVRLVDAAIAACTQISLDEAARKKTVLTIEGRRANLNTVLLAIQFHAQHEYPTLLKYPDGRTQAAILATNVNDCFLLGRFADAPALAAVQPALSRLLAHLQAIPQSTSN